MCEKVSNTSATNIVQQKTARGACKRLCAKASGLGLSQAPQHETDHGDENPGFFTTGKHFIVFGKPAPGRKPSKSAFHNPAMWKHLKAAGTNLLPIDDGIFGSPDAS